MKTIVSALTVALLTTLGAGSAAQAAVHTIDFSAVAEGSGISYTGGNLRTSTAIDLDGSTWSVSGIGAGDDSGLALGGTLTLTPTATTYGTLSGPVDLTLTTPIVKSWDGADGPFTETLTTLEEVDRGRNSIAFVLTGTVTGGDFTDAPATLQLSFTQAGGPGNVVSASLSNNAVTSSIPEPSTWVMMGLGFVGLGYAAVRRGSKDRTALAI
jgi:hypothetical protein